MLRKFIILIKSLHKWMEKEPADAKIYKKFIGIFFAFAGIVFSTLMVPKIFYLVSIISGRAIPWQAAIYSIIILMLGAIVSIVIVLCQVITGKELKVSTKYQLLLSIFSVPISIFAHKLINFIAIKYEQNKINN